MTPTMIGHHWWVLSMATFSSRKITDSMISFWIARRFLHPTVERYPRESLRRHPYLDALTVPIAFPQTPQKRTPLSRCGPFLPEPSGLPGPPPDECLRFIRAATASHSDCETIASS